LQHLEYDDEDDVHRWVSCKVYVFALFKVSDEGQLSLSDGLQTHRHDVCCKLPIDDLVDMEHT